MHRSIYIGREILSEEKIDGYINSYKICHVVKGIL
jgi:hypothetical protein